MTKTGMSVTTTRTWLRTKIFLHESTQALGHAADTYLTRGVVARLLFEECGAHVEARGALERGGEVLRRGRLRVGAPRPPAKGLKPADTQNA